jgi:hypothetical protein
LDWSGSGYGPVDASCEHGNEPLGFIKCWEFLEYLNNGGLLKKGSAPWVSLIKHNAVTCGRVKVYLHACRRQNGLYRQIPGCVSCLKYLWGYVKPWVLEPTKEKSYVCVWWFWFQSFPSTFFQFIIIHSFVVVLFELLRALLNKHQTDK